MSVHSVCERPFGYDVCVSVYIVGRKEASNEEDSQPMYDEHKINFNSNGWTKSKRVFAFISRDEKWG